MNGILADLHQCSADDDMGVENAESASIRAAEVVLIVVAGTKGGGRVESIAKRGKPPAAVPDAGHVDGRGPGAFTEAKSNGAVGKRAQAVR